MVYNIINSGKLKIYRIAFSFLIMISYMTTFSSCMTTYNYTETPESVLSDSDCKIVKVELINGKTIKCTDKFVNFETGKDSTKYLVIRSFIAGSVESVNKDEIRIPEIEISRINIERSEVNITKTVFLTLGIAALAVVLVFIIALAVDPPHLNFQVKY